MGWITGQVVSIAEPAERRGKARAKLRLDIEPPAGIDGLAQVMDLSASGMMVHCDHPFEPGERFVVTLPEAGQIEARVVWKRLTLMGCAFAEPLPRAVLAAIRLRARPAE